MKTQSSFLSVLFLALYAISPALGEIVFQDGFENPTLDPAWVVSATNDGRVVRTQDFIPATGNGHMVMDDGVTDTMFSASEATLTLNMRNKKSGVLTFKAKSLGDEPHAPPTGGSTLRLFDAVSISTNGGLSWRSAQSLAGLTGSWQTFTVDLDAAVAATGGRYDTNFLLRFSQYDNAVAGIDGIAIDDVVLNAEPDQRVLIELPSSVKEGSVGNIAYLVLSIPPTAPMAVTLTTTPVGELVFPASIIIPAGETVLMVKFKVNNDSLLNLSRTVTVTPSIAGATSFAASVQVLDDEEQPQVWLLLPSEVIEGLAATNNATVSLSMPAVLDATVTLTTSPAGQISVPATVKIPAGQTSAAFTLQATNDTVLDGDVPVAVSATLSGADIVTATVVAADNELPALDLVLPPTIPEGQTATGSVSVSVARGSDLLVYLTSANSAALGVTAQVTIPAGQISAPITLTAVNNTLVDLSRSLIISAAGTGVSTATRAIMILDDEPAPVITLSVPPALNEADTPTGNASVKLSSAAAVATTVTIFGFPFGELNLPATVIIPPGQTSVKFTAQAVNDTKIDGNVAATVRASAPGLAAVTTATITIDNELRTIALTLPTLIMEGGSASGTVSIPGTLQTNLVVALSGNNNSALTVPSTVTISAGSTSANFILAALDNTARDGTRKVTVMGSAASFASASGTLEVRDNELAAYRISGLTDIVNIDAPVPATIAALDVNKNVIPGYIGNVRVVLVLPDGSTQALTPSTVAISGAAGWSGTLTVPATTAYPLKLRATDTSGTRGESLPFDTMRMLPIPASDFVWDASRSRIYASVRAASGGTYANRIVAIDPATALVTGSAVSDQDPVKLALTSGGEFLYAAQDGTGTVARIDPSTMNVISSFAVGTQNSDKLYAGDMCAVSGQPDLVVVSRYRKNFTPSQRGVAVYENGLIRPSIAQNYIDSIEPSLDSTLYFGYNGDTGFSQLRLTATGMTDLSLTTRLFSGYGAIRSAGNILFTGTGEQVDGLQLRRLGSFDLSDFSPVCPDSTNRQVFYLERQSGAGLYGKIGAYDTLTMRRIQHLTLPAEIYRPVTAIEAKTHSFIRWGENGLAFIHYGGIALINSKRLVPSDPPANIRVNISASPNSASVNLPLAYTVTVTNDGPNPARQTKVHATFSEGQTIGHASASTGNLAISGLLSGSLTIPNLAAGASATLTVRSTPLSAGAINCVATATSDATDPLLDNNTDSKVVVVGYNPGPDRTNGFRLDANNLIHDATRNLLWVAIPPTAGSPLGKVIVSIDPTTGHVSQPIALGASPRRKTMAISENGRYLYVGLEDIPEVARVDLQQTPPAVIRIPVVPSIYGTNYANDIEVLPGDGTSILVAEYPSRAVAVYDGLQRKISTESFVAEHIERTGTANTYICSHLTTLSRVSINTEAITVSQGNGSYYSLEGGGVMRGAGNRILNSRGILLNSTNLEEVARLGVAILGFAGIPAFDESKQAAYLLAGSTLTSYRMSDGVSQGSFTLTGTPQYDWAQILVHWTDGFAATGIDGKIYIARWLAPSDNTAPTLVSITDSASGGNIPINVPVTYTVTFSEDINESTVQASDFGIEGTAGGNIGAITEISSGVFTVVFTPTSPGTLRLRINAGASLSDFAGNALNTTAALVDNTTITVVSSNAPLPWIAADIGTGMIAGSTTFNAGTVTQSGSGVIGSTSDKFHFAHQTLTGDGEIIARISNLDNTGTTSRVGVMIRDSLAANSKHVFMGMSGTNGYRLVHRASTGGLTTATSSSTGTVPNTWVRLIRSGNTITAFKSANGTSWTMVSSISNMTFASTCYVGLALGSSSVTTLNTSQFTDVRVIQHLPLPLPWSNADISTGMIAGSTTFNAGTFTQSGSGVIGSTSDKFHFAHQALTGDGEIIARISNQDNTDTTTRVGVMIRDSLAANSKHVFMAMSGTGTFHFQYRASTDGLTMTNSSSTGTVPNTWVRLVRSGNTIIAFRSANGTSWEVLGSSNMTLAPTCYVGLAVGSSSVTTLNTSQFSNVSVIP